MICSVAPASLPVRAKFKYELAREYGLHRNTLRVWCEQVGIHGRSRLSVGQVTQFYQHFGLPGLYQQPVE
ncbi:hypothetical protein [Hymenobacter pini]|uniref:hypothetical protein n=1 Tax=Hymenobacter pini TaxID=2880879 RepID=UPI001CF331DD|nr:hypothetical protein [Hymenobacter pini]MCA8830487.1 hypothetical protein [Hymenobacter pini]